MSETPRWAREATVPQLADVALVADDLLRSETFGISFSDALRETRRIALDELVRRGEIDGYGFIPEVEFPSQAQRARTLRLRTYSAVGS